MLEVTNLSCVRGGRTLFKDLNFKVQPRTLLQVRGPNGSGKTSLLRIICGLLSPETGEVSWEGTNTRKLGDEFNAKLIYLGHRNGIKEELTSFENLRISSGLAGANIPNADAAMALGRVGLTGREHLPARFLSEGQRRRSALARLLVRTAKLWVLDEVLASLDTAAVTLVTSLLNEHLESGGLAIVATHHELATLSGSIHQLELA